MAESIAFFRMTAPLAFLIPSRDRHGDLARWQPTVQRAARRVGAEILVCDQSATPWPGLPGITVLHRPDLGGLPAARNVLLAATTAPLCCFLDDDTEIAADFAQRLLAQAAAEPAALGWGPVVEVRPVRLRRLFRCVQLGALADDRRLAGSRRGRPAAALFGCAMAFRTAAIRAVGFDARLPGYALGEDLDACLRLATHTGQRRPFRWCSDLRAIHHQAAANRSDRWRRGLAKGSFLHWLARRHGGGNPATALHLGLALLAASAGRGQEPAAPLAVWRGAGQSR